MAPLTPPGTADRTHHQVAAAKGGLSSRRYLWSMTTTNSFGDRRSRVQFDRVESDGSPMGDRSFELSQEIDLAGKDLLSVTWVYEAAGNVVKWSSPIEELFGFEPGVLGFSVLRADARPPSGQPECSDQADGSTGPTSGRIFWPRS